MTTHEHEQYPTPVHHPEQARDQEGEGREDLASRLGNRAVERVLNAPGVQRAGATSAQQLDESVARAIQDRQGLGKPLDDDTRVTMEDTLGHDLTDVRVHTDRSAHELNEAVGARAFTAGSDVFFKQGTYDPHTSSGRELLGHELTHVVQQRTGTSGLQAGEVSDPSDAAEQHAAEVGSHLGRQSAPPTPVAQADRDADGPAVHRASEATEEEDEELQASLDPSVQRETSEEEDEEVQMSPDPSTVQRQSEDEMEDEEGAS